MTRSLILTLSPASAGAANTNVKPVRSLRLKDLLIMVAPGDQMGTERMPCSRDSSAAVDAHGRTGGEGRRGEKQHRIGDVLRLTNPAGRQMDGGGGEHRFALLLGHAGPEGGCDQPRRDGVHAYRCQFHCT